MYGDFYRRGDALRWLFRFDVRYRCRRLLEVAGQLSINLEDKRVLDVGFGGGHMLACFPKSCRLHGAEVSPSAVERAENNPLFSQWRGSEFTLIREEAVESLPAGPFDVIVSSHTIEHVPDDRSLLRALRNRLKPDGTFFLFVPIEEPHYNPDHLRNYSVASISALVDDAGFDVFFVEKSMHINGHVWKYITIPSRRRWPVLKPIVDGFRLCVLSALTYPGQRWLDSALDKLGFSPRQAFLVSRIRSGSGHIHNGPRPTGRGGTVRSVSQR